MTEESFIYEPAQGPSRIIITADHATNKVPEWINGGDLGIAEEDMNRHIAYDVGSLGVARTMAQALGAHLVATQFSRLVIDPNRGEDDPTLLMKIYDRTIIPANQAMDEEERTRRIEALYRPYHQKVSEVIESVEQSGESAILIAMHSFTPQLRGRDPRPWHVGILSTQDRRMADPLLAALEAEGDLVVGDNVPYSGALEGDSMSKHAIRDGRPHALFEVRNDLISTPEDEILWGERLARVMKDVLSQNSY